MVDLTVNLFSYLQINKDLVDPCCIQAKEYVSNKERFCIIEFQVRKIQLHFISLQ